MIHNYFDKAKRIARGVMTLSVGALLPFMTACLDEEVEQQPAADMVPLSFYLQTAESQQTRAYIGDLGADPAAESTINDVKVWIYRTIGEEYKCVGYADALDEGSTNKVTVILTQSVNNGDAVDVYVIANAVSAGLGSLNGTTTLADLTNATIAADKFSVASPVTSVPEKGLPMSIIKKGCTIKRTAGSPIAELYETNNTIKITRAVSKIYFAFGMYESDFGEVVGISLEGSQIAKNERILPVDYVATAPDYTAPYWGDLQANIIKTGTATNDYETLATPAIIFGSTNGGTAETPVIAVPKADVHTTTASDDPANYVWKKWIGDFTDFPDNQKAADYITAITPFITHKVYLRESDQKLKGKIYYRFRIPTGETTEQLTDIKSADFEMDATSSVQDFARNHVWIVYSYFTGGKLEIEFQVIDWKLSTPVGKKLTEEGEED